MKHKIWLLFILLLFITGCTTHKKQVETIIEKKNHIFVTINYPVSGIQKLDNQVKKEIQMRYQTFSEQQKEFVDIASKAELNIDYTIEEIEHRYISITLTIFSNSNLLANPITEIKTYVFDKKKKKFLTILNIIPEAQIKNVKEFITKDLKKNYKDCLLEDELAKTLKQWDQLQFTFDDETLTFYFNPYEIAAGYFNIIKVSIPIEHVGLLFDIEKGKTEPKWKEVEPTTKVIDPNKKSIAITFDDGPSKYTSELLDVLKTYDASGTFFVIGNKVEIYSDTMRRMVKEGNEIGNHSYNHKWLTRVTQQEFDHQINQTQDIIKKVTGFTPRLMRPTYGAVNEKVRHQTNLKVVMWTVDTRDWENKNVKSIIRKTLPNIQDGSIILMHDTKERTVEVLKKLLHELKKENYQFVTVSELEQIQTMKQNNYEK